jgi:serine protease Do
LKTLLVFILTFLICANTNAGEESAGRPDFGASILKVRATNTDGSISLGSGVLFEPGKLATSCHVTRRAKHIEVLDAAETMKWTVRSQRRDIHHDLCILSVPGVASGALSAAAPGEPRIGQFVYAVGYPNGGELAISGGEVKGLHAYEDAKIIRTSAPFDYGASGGALFDRDGRLLGILTFKARAGGAYHFALPVKWLAASSDAAEADQAFWEGPRENQPYFLRALALEIDHKWEALLALAEMWWQRDAPSPEARSAIATAQRGLGREPDATADSRDYSRTPEKFELASARNAAEAFR